MAEQKLLVKREGDFHYPIYFEKAFSGLAQTVREEGLSGHKICVVTDSHVEPLYLKVCNGFSAGGFFPDIFLCL